MGNTTRPNWAGLREHRRSRTTGTMVSLYDGEAAGLDTTAGRWQTVCEDHSAIISHHTLDLAYANMTEVAEWCDVPGGCQERLADPKGGQA